MLFIIAARRPPEVYQLTPATGREEYRCADVVITKAKVYSAHHHGTAAALAANFCQDR